MRRVDCVNITSVLSFGETSSALSLKSLSANLPDTH